MPESYKPKRRCSHTLMDASRYGQTIRVTCPYDKQERLFLPDDLKVAFGNVECDDLRFMLKCSKCNGSVEVKSESMSAAERQRGILRRLVEVYYIRQARWRDERPG